MVRTHFFIFLIITDYVDWFQSVISLPAKLFIYCNHSADVMTPDERVLTLTFILYCVMEN
jgi:hypothetical protein